MHNPIVLTTFNANFASYQNGVQPEFLQPFLAESQIALLQRIDSNHLPEILTAQNWPHWVYAPCNWEGSPESLEKVYSESTERPPPNMAGLMIACLWPLSSAKNWILSSNNFANENDRWLGHCALQVTVQHPQKKLTLLNALPCHPVDFAQKQDWQNEVQRIFTIAKNENIDIIAGDFHISAEQSTWQSIQNQNWDDPWTQLNPDDRGVTWNDEHGVGRLDRFWANEKSKKYFSKLWVKKNPNGLHCHNAVWAHLNL